ncbi:hypothetical protein SNE40_000968 [Patella caerulea]|uniref:Uncharacterized protein n=1 Tax=Patella caerulea TaxID=87958 RepID=A0AAN8KHN7_PATCE
MTQLTSTFQYGYRSHGDLTALTTFNEFKAICYENNSLTVIISFLGIFMTKHTTDAWRDIYIVIKKLINVVCSR